MSKRTEAKRDSQRQKALEAILLATRKIGGAESALLLDDGGGRAQVAEVIPSGVEVLDKYVMACGGYPVGRIVEVYGEEASGKSSLVLAALAGAQRAGGLAILADAEFSFDETRAALFGADRRSLILLQPTCMEEWMDMVPAVLEKIPLGIGPNILALDSLAALPPRSELEGAAGDTVVAERARLLSKACRTFPALAAKRRTCLLFVNQIREKIGVMFGDKYTTPGGKAVKFHASLRLQLFSGKSLKNEHGEHVGKVVTVLGVKNRFAPPFRKARVPLVYAAGWSSDGATMAHARQLEFVKKVEGRWPTGPEALALARENLEAAHWTRSLPQSSVAANVELAEDAEDAA